ncbi:hypothetical protein Pla123a_35240 [Posidoniimonas polymericola]|uniref:PIN domain-containing protein n=1 Tax=Posidoniimonas polymericola TaxID=2528002 RepID=A0A5C5YD55_9BACT|nr:putative toxin-antitoxin system toxin component, PIN family [Posidoniimonas polymericola]TWT73636.1 hypothetical protein Pla123a_35240 [Posidoniimonas polymericola]
MSAPRVVFDCNVYFQALIGPTGPAGSCLDAGGEGTVSLYISQYILNELRDVCLRPKIAHKFGITVQRLDYFCDGVRRCATFLPEPLEVFLLQRDPKDEHYINLAIAASASLVVSRDRDLLALADPWDPVGQAFQASYPTIEVVTPVELLARLAAG